jgi:hypothetical protein
MGRPRIDLPRLKNLTRPWQSSAIALQVAEDIVSNFRIICVAGLTASLVVLFADAAAAQSATPTDQTGRPYLAGLRPPHEAHKAAHVSANHVNANHANAKNDQVSKSASKKSQKPAAKIAKPSTKHAANSTTHARGRSSAKTSRIDWPQVDSVTGEDRSVPPTALQFTADDTKLNETSSSVTSTPAPKAATAAKGSQPSPPGPAGDERNAVAPVAADQSLATSTVVQAERFEPPAQNIEQAAAPQSQNAPAIEDSAPKPRSKAGSSVAQTLVMFAGAISAALVGCWIFGFGSNRGIRLGV